jgi:sugar/nucleoside kinase (ribokinase family)
VGPSSVDLLCVGESFEDLIFHGLPGLPEVGGETRAQGFARTWGGGTFITAVAAARLGVGVQVVSGLAPEAASRLRGERVTAKNLARPGEPTAVTAALSTRRDRAFATFDGINTQVEERLLGAFERRLPRARHVHGALGPRHAVRWAVLLARLRERGITSSWDFGWHDELPRDRAFRALLASLDWVFVNEPEARYYSGSSTLSRAVARWPRLARTTVVKRGAAGAMALTGGRIVKVPASRVRALDTTGAGDAFNGGFLAGMIRGCSVRECLRLGALVGSLSTRRPGGLDGLPHLSELPAWARTAVGDGR